MATKKKATKSYTDVTATVNDVAILRQLVANTSSSIELLREAVSNSMDASAKNIDIKLTNPKGGDVWDVIIQDDGSGMEEKHMRAFFSTADSVKDYSAKAIGEKGVGSKTTFVANKIEIHSVRTGTSDYIFGEMDDPMGQIIVKKQLPQWKYSTSPAGPSPISGSGTQIKLTGVTITRFNGKKCNSAQEIADRTMHYLRSSCASGTVKNRHASRPHVAASVINAGQHTDVSVEVSIDGKPPVTLGPVPAFYEVPNANVVPAGGTKDPTGIERNSFLYCDIHDFSESKTISIGGKTEIYHYDGTAIIAGSDVRDSMLQHEFKQGWTHKSQMGVHLCKDFIPMRTDNALSKELIGKSESEYYYNFKIFLNSQEFTLNADRNVVTNLEQHEVDWIFDDFKQKVWPHIDKKYQPMKAMVLEEKMAIEAIEKTQRVLEIKKNYSGEKNIGYKPGSKILFVKEPKKEADVSHLLAMMLQSGLYKSGLKPLEKFGQYIDNSTDVICEGSGGSELLVEIEMSLPNLSKHNHPLTSYDLVVVWDLGHWKTSHTFQAPYGKSGTLLKVKLIEPRSKQFELKWGTVKKQVIVLSDIV